VRLNDEERAMLAGEFGEPRRWAVEHQVAVGAFFDAADLVPVSQAHIMANTESLGEAGIALLERLAATSETERRVRVPILTDPRGLDFNRTGGWARPTKWPRSKRARSPRCARSAR
jgi:predicted aconitase